jgi:hypothetical protein
MMVRQVGMTRHQKPKSGSILEAQPLPPPELNRAESSSSPFVRKNTLEVRKEKLALR